jgi:hypothetical protein
MAGYGSAPPDESTGTPGTFGQGWGQTLYNLHTTSKEALGEVGKAVQSVYEVGSGLVSEYKQPIVKSVKEGWGKLVFGVGVATVGAMDMLNNSRTELGGKWGDAWGNTKKTFSGSADNPLGIRIPDNVRHLQSMEHNDRLRFRNMGDLATDPSNFIPMDMIKYRGQNIPREPVIPAGVWDDRKPLEDERNIRSDIAGYATGRSGSFPLGLGRGKRLGNIKY